MSRDPEAFTGFLCDDPAELRGWADEPDDDRETPDRAELHHLGIDMRAWARDERRAG